MNRNEIITTKIKALWTMKEKKAWPRDPDVAAEVIRQYINALSKVPTKELAALLDYFFSDQTGYMPLPFQILQLWTKQGLAEQRTEFSQPVWSDMRRSARTEYARGVLELLKRRFGYPVSDIVVTHKNSLKQDEYIHELKELGIKHDVPWDEKNYQECLPKK